jgi:Tol biopolymer transport system component
VSSRRLVLVAVSVLAVVVGVLTAGASHARSGGADLPYLVYVSDRDGDEDLYAVRADGKRTVQITRDRTRLLEPVLSPDGRWVFTDWSSKVVSTNGLQSYRLRLQPISADNVVFSPDGRWFAYGQDSDFVRGPPRMRLMATSTGRSRPLRAGIPLSFSPDSSRLVVTDERWSRLNVIDVSSGRSHRIVATDDGLLEDVGWSPDGKRFAFLQGSALRYVEMRATPGRPRTTLRHTRLVDEVCSPWWCSAQWLDSDRLGVVQPPEDAVPDEVGPVEVAVVTVGAKSKTRLLTTTARMISVVWSLDGSRVAYVVERSSKRSDVVVQKTSNGASSVPFRSNAIHELSWSPAGHLAVSYWAYPRHYAVALVQPGKPAYDIQGGSLSGPFGRWSWSPRGEFLNLGLRERVTSQVVILAAVAPARSITRAVVEGNSKPLGWVPGSAGPARAPTILPLPAAERVAAPGFVSSGKVAEISANANRVAAIVEKSALDCNHALAWTAGASRVLRFTRLKRCGNDGENVLGDAESVRISLEGTQVKWLGLYWGNYVYISSCTADMRRPRAGVRCSGGGEGWEGPGPGRPPPEQATRLGVSVKVENGTVVLVRSSDGRTRRIHPPSGAVDAELEDDGLFYAYNTSGAMKGHIVFVPFAKLFD